MGAEAQRLAPSVQDCGGDSSSPSALLLSVTFSAVVARTWLTDGSTWQPFAVAQITLQRAEIAGRISLCMGGLCPESFYSSRQPGQLVRTGTFGRMRIHSN